MNEEDEAFNEIERRSKAKKAAVESSVNAKEALTKLLVDSYDQGVKDALESVVQITKELRTEPIRACIYCGQLVVKEKNT